VAAVGLDMTAQIGKRATKTDMDDREAIYRVLRDAVPGFRKEAV
jgi:hypothetical protein